MKKLFFLLLLLPFSNSPLKAQIDIGVKGGLNYAYSLCYRELYKPYLGYNAGISGEYAVTNCVNVGLEASYSLKGVCDKLHHPLEGDVTVKQSFHYIDVPLYLVWRLNSMIALEAGPVGEFLIKSNLVNSYDGYFQKLTKATDVELAIMVGARGFITPKWFFEMRVMRGLVQFSDQETSGNIVYQLSTGYYLTHQKGSRNFRRRWR